jgi:hypothetical protein
VRAIRRAAALCVAALGLLATLAAPAQAEEEPYFWAGVNSGMRVTALLHGQAVFPYVVVHKAASQVECYLRVYEVKGPNWTPIGEKSLGTQTALITFCGSVWPFSYTWTDVDLEPGGLPVQGGRERRYAVGDRKHLVRLHRDHHPRHHPAGDRDRL